MKNKKQKVLNYLFNKLDSMKLEIYNTFTYKNDIRNLYDFEKDSRLVQQEERLIIRKKKVEEKKEESIIDLKRYLMECKFMPLSKIFNQCHKIIFYDEYIYLIKEAEINKEKFIKINKNNRLLNKERISKEIVHKYEDDQKFYKEKFHKGLLRYFKFKQTFLPKNVNLNIKNQSNAFLFLEKIDNTEISEDLQKPTNLLKSFKENIMIYKDCKSKNSIFYKFIKNLHSAGLHQSFRKINEKFVYSNVQELSKNIIKEEPTDSQDLSNFNQELSNYNQDLVNYNQDLISTPYNETENLEEETPEIYHYNSLMQNKQEYEIRYPFYDKE
ncbi:uncharacterized protein VNE69_10146 [Vairimorpha necatrix]|uniref:Uncharacterized protein n=1 Tax=Vairimorpha necatrix TaxID=6039 RepID=A0AAX4JFQ3_9MICR